MKDYQCPKCGNEFQADPTKDLVKCPDCGNMDFSEILKNGFKISGFTLKRKIGAGAMGEVWLAEQVSMQRDVAIKILSVAAGRKRKGFIERFQAEVKNSAKLFHQNIVTAFDAGYDNGFYYLASKYVRGSNLEDIFKKSGRIPESEALSIALSISEALHYSWVEFKMMHRDIKPSNIIITPKAEPILLDMGLSKCMGEDPTLTYDGQLVGTPYYMSPEQAKGEKDIDFRTDIYSLGASLYHLVTGQVPFSGKTAISVVTKHVSEQLIPPKKILPSISDGFNEFVVKMMEKKPKERFQSWEAVIERLKTILEFKKASPLSDSMPSSNAIITESASNETAARSIAETLQRNNDKEPESKVSSAKKALNFFIFAIFLIALISLIYANFNYLSYLIKILDDNIFFRTIDKYLNYVLSLLTNIVQSDILAGNSGSKAVLKLNSALLLVEYFALVIMLFSGFWAASKAAVKERSRLVNFLGGFFVPIIYPLVLFRFLSCKLKTASDKNNLTEIEVKKYFSKIQKKNQLSGHYMIELLDDSRLAVNCIKGIKKNVIVVEILTTAGLSKTMNIPYFRIKKVEKI